MCFGSSDSLILSKKDVPTNGLRGQGLGLYILDSGPTGRFARVRSRRHLSRFRPDPAGATSST
jgi:hypothetical protein